MQSSNYVSLVVSGSADLYVQERIKDAERAALIKAAKGRRRSNLAALRLVVGQFMVSAGKRVAGRPQRRQRALDVPAAFKIAR